MKTYNNQEYYSIEEIAEIFGEKDKPLHIVSTRKIIRENFKTIKFGRVKYVLKEDIDKYIQNSGK